MFCTNCGSKLSEGARFCSTCGARVAEVFEVPEVEEKPAAFGFTEAAPDPEPVKPVEAPLKKRATFDWSNVIDEPKKKTIPDIKSPWATTGGIDENELYAEMGTATERSRTMSFIDVLKAEKQQRLKKHRLHRHLRHLLKRRSLSSTQKFLIRDSSNLKHLQQRKRKRKFRSSISLRFMKT